VIKAIIAANKAKNIPLDYRLALLDKNPRAANVLRAAAEKAGWGQSLPKGVGRGVSLHDSFGSFVAAVVEADVSDNKTIKLRRLTCAIDCGMTVNPDMVRAQLEGGLIFGLSAAMHNEITFKDGRVEQSNFNDYLMLRMKDFPPVEVVHVESSEAPGGVGETGTVSAAPALGNAIFAATGRRLRRYPFDTALRASQT
jgi:isoquinoline 1-oxidoreductase beta subunit